MQINKLHLSNFKNYSEAEFEFSDRINIFTGENGAGKTNILDAIYYLSFCKSYFNPIDSQNIRHETDYFAIKGHFLNQSESEDIVLCSVKRNDKKKISLNKKEYERFADHIGNFPLVIISPSDSQMIYEGGDERRRYMDSVISQFDKNYLEQLIGYNKILQQRNAVLKQLADNRNQDMTILDVWDEQLVRYAAYIYKTRNEFLEEFIPVMREYYGFISNEKEKVSIEYKSQLTNKDFLQELKFNRKKDIAFGHTTIGIHRDDIQFVINYFPLRKYGSQGQQKSFLVALKLAQFEYTFKKKGFKPIVLLDDIFDKFDIHRVEQLMKLVSKNQFGQIFITDTNKERIDKIFEKIEVEVKTFLMVNGKIEQINIL